MQYKTLKLGMRTENRQSDLNPFHRAAHEGHAEAIANLVTAEPDINSRTSSGWTALHLAAAHNHPEVVELLFLHGADPELTLDDGATALHMSATNGNDKVISLLLKHGSKLGTKTLVDDFTALHLAALRGHKETLRILIDHGDSLDEPANYGSTALNCACRQGHAECVRMLALAGANIEARAEPEQDTPLMNAVALDNGPMVQTLLDIGADIDAVQRQGRTAVQVAAYYGHLKALQALISGGANLDIMDHEEYTPLRCAIEWKHPEAAMLLLQHRVRINTTFTDHEHTSLHLAVSSQYTEVIEALLKKGADVEAFDADGDPPLQWAVHKGDLNSVKVLLRYGAQINRQNPSSGETVLHWAVKCGHISVTELLLANGADTSLIDVDTVTKITNATEDNFDICRALVVTGVCTENLKDLIVTQEPFQSPLSTNFREQVPDTAVESNAEYVEAQSTIRHPVYEIPLGSDAVKILSQTQESFTHYGTKCDGPLCLKQSEPIKGVRYKCTCCENVDFCFPCMTSFHNNHDATHAMIKCLSPTSCNIIWEIDEITKQNFLESAGDPSMSAQDLSHVVYAEIEEWPLLQLLLKVSKENGFNESHARLLVKDLGPTFFPVVKSRSTRSVPRRPNILREGDKQFEGVAYYKIDEAGNIRVKHQPMGVSSNMYREDDLMIHHDSNSTVDMIFGQLRLFEYGDTSEFHKWAWEGRLVTRVVDLRPGKFDDKIEIEIRVVDLSQGPKYEALSYTWKETAYERVHVSCWTKEVDETFRSMARFTHAVYCRDSSDHETYLVIGSGLRDALRRLRDPSETKTYWIDQLSINQRDHGERAFQVSGMVFFYNRAQRVTVWSGDEDDYTRDAFNVFRKLAQASRVLGYLPGPDVLMADAVLDLPPLESPVWKSIIQFFTRPVFSRCWVIQEIVVGQKVMVRCGEHSITWDDLSRAALTLSQGLWLRVLSEDIFDVHHPPQHAGSVDSIDSSSRDRNRKPLSDVIMLNGLREDFQSLKENSLEKLLYLTGRYEASDPRDQVYSVLGMQSAKINPTDQQDIQPDYKKPIADVFTEATKVCITRSSSLDICGLNYSLSSKKIESLPSWVPDYTASTMSCSTSFSRPIPENPYQACGDAPLVSSWPFKDRNDLLVTSSIKVSTVADVSQHVLSDEGSVGAVVSEWTRMASLGPEYPTGEFAPDAFWRTVVADNSGPWRQIPAPDSYNAALGAFFGQHFIHHLMSQNKPETVDEIDLAAAGNAIIATLMEDADTASPNWLSGGTESTADKLPDPTPDPSAVPAFFLASTNRRFFVTSDKLFGIGPKDMQVGDEIHVLTGARVPFVMRRIEKAQDAATVELVEGDGLDLQRMIGETYVHGLMSGEALSKDNMEWEGICVC